MSLKNKVIAFLLMFTLALPMSPKKAQATGFPVIDIASIVQAVTDYSQQLMQYAEMIQQGAQQGLQIIEQVRQYEQMVMEYETMLNNLKDLSQYISEGDMRAAFQLVTDSNLSQFVSPEFLQMSDDLLEVWVAVDEIRSLQFGGIRDIEESLNKINDLFPDNPDAAAKAEIILNYQKATVNRAAINAQYEKQVDGFEQNLSRQEQAISSLGGESEIASLQTIAHLLVSQQKMQVASMRQQAATSSASVPIEEIVARKQAEALEAKLIKAQQILSDSITYQD